MRISDWSSDVCSSDLPARANEKGAVVNTKSGALVEERNFVAQQKAQRLRNGDSVERNNLRRLYHSERGVNAVLVDGSNSSAKTRVRRRAWMLFVRPSPTCRSLQR